MAGPWEKYQQSAPTDGPWSKFKPQADAEAAPRSIEAPPAASGIDRFMANPLVRFATGVADLPLGAAQAVANVGKMAADRGAAQTGLSPSGLLAPLAGALNERLQSAEESKRRGMAASGDETDVAGFLGSLAAGGAAVKGMPLAQSFMRRIGQGAATGAAFGAAAPIKNGGEDFGSDKAAQVGIGALVGGAVPAVIGGAKGIYDKGRDVAAVLSRKPEALSRLTGRYYREQIGEDNVQPVVDALRRSRPDVAYQQPTASQALRNVPEGSPIAAQTRITATQPGGASAAFGKRWQDQQNAIADAIKTRGRITSGLRERALDSATNIDKQKLANDFARIANHPEINTNSGVQRALTAARAELEKAQTSRNIYGVRKMIQDMIDGKAGSELNVSKQTIPRLIEMKQAIDDAIEAGGGGNEWRQYLHVFSNRSAKIDAAKEALKKPFSSPQRTNVQGGQRIAQREIPALPNPLIREVMVFNRLASMVKDRAEPAIDETMARQLLNPKELASALESANPQNRALLEALLRYSRAVPVTAVQE